MNHPCTDTNISVHVNPKSRLDTLLHNMFLSISGDTWQQKLDTCNKCNCCTRHSINRPSIFQPWVELPFSDTSHYTKNNMCSCDCRHKARFICRQFHNTT